MRDRDVERFWNFVEKSEGCWEWRGSRNSVGYGKFGVGKKYYGAHRLMWQMIYGQIPDSYYVCHRCDNPGCVNPEHLFLGTSSDNAQDSLQKGRRAIGERHYASRLIENQVVEVRQRFVEGNVTKEKLASDYGVSGAMIGKIIRRERWKHL